MQNSGFEKSAEQCSAKIKKLSMEYRIIKNKHGKTGWGRKQWQYFEAMDKSLGHKPATEPPIIVDLYHNVHTKNNLFYGTSV